jgi:hypothetical protein
MLIKITTHRIFLLGLAVSDFIVCSVTVPFEIIDVEHSHTFHSTEACKVFRSLNYLFIFTSILMLMALSHVDIRLNVLNCGIHSVKCLSCTFDITNEIDIIVVVYQNKIEYHDQVYYLYIHTL